MDIKNEILDYIKCNESTGALLLTGPWGCGKSFLMKQIANELNQEKKAAISVISLFGLDSISAINKRVKDEYTSFKLGTIGKVARKISKGIATLAKDGLAVAGIASPGVTGLSAASQGLTSALSYDIFGFIDIQNAIGNDDNKRKFVIVFDDLERCGINSKKDLLGAINNFVENKQIKVIIIADEDKISEDDYIEYKEKLISRTLCMSADYDLIIESIVNHYAETSNGYRDFLIQNKNLLKQVFFESDSNNIRTFKCILADFERVYATWKETDVPTDNMKWALYTFGAEVYISKKSKKKEKNPKKPKPAFFTDKNDEQFPNKGKHKSSFFSFDHWINQGVWDNAQFVEELERKYVDKVETSLFRFLTYGFWDLQQNDIDEGLPQAVSLAYDGSLSRDQMITLIGNIHALRDNGIAVSVDVDYQRMEKGLEKRLFKVHSGEIEEPKSHTFIEERYVDEDAKMLLKALEKFDDRLTAFNNKSKFIQYLSGDDSISYFTIKGLCLEEFDDDLFEMFTKRYNFSDNSTKRDISQAFLGLSFDHPEYSNEENIHNTKEKFDRLIRYLEELDDTDSIAKLINKSFIEKISEKNRQLQNT